MLYRRPSAEFLLLGDQSVLVAGIVLEALYLGPLTLAVLLPVDDLILQVFNPLFQVEVLFNFLVSARCLALLLALLFLIGREG